MLNTRKLRGVMAEAGVTQRDIAKALGKSENTVSNRIKGISPFDVSEVLIICDLLGITDNSLKAEIFLHKTSQK